MASNESVIKVYSRTGVYSRSLAWDVNLDSLDFTLTAQRGCSGATLNVKRDADSGYILERDEFITVYFDDESEVRAYTGFVSTRSRDRRGFNQVYEIRGFADYLAGISISELDSTKKVWFGSTDPETPADYIVALIPDESRNVETVAEAVEWVYLNCIQPDYPDILWDEDLISLTDADIEHLEFDSAMDVFQVLEELSTIASVENSPVYFGVNPDRTLYFIQLTSADPQLLDVNYLNKDFSREDFGEVFNILLLTTGERDDNNKKIRYRFQSDTSLLTYRPRRKTLEKSWIRSAADAGRYAVGFFAKYSTPFESFTISQYFSDTPYDNLYQPWASWIKVTDGQSGEQRFTPFLEIQYHLANVNEYTLSVARMEDDLEVGADGSNTDDGSDDDTEETAVDPSDPDKLIVIAPTTGLMTSEDGLVDDFTVVLTVAPSALVTVRLSGAVSTGVDRDRLFTSATWNTLQSVEMTDVNLDDTAELGVRLAAKPGQDIDVIYTADSGVSPSGATLTFTPLNWDTVQTITFTGIDSPADPTFNVTFILGTELFDSVNVVATTDSPGEGLIRHSGSGSYVESIDFDFEVADFDDTQAVQIQGQDDDGTLELGVRLNTAPDTNVVVSFDPALGITPTPLTFTPENWETEQRLIMTGVEADVVYPLFNTYAFDMEVDSGTTLPITVVLSLRSGVQDDLDIAPVLFPEFATFTALNTPASFEVAHTQFHKKETDVLYNITFTSTSDDPDYNDATVDDLVVTNIDNDLKGVRVSPLSDLNTAERGENKDQEFTIVLASEPTAAVVITLHTYDSDSGQWKDPEPPYTVDATDKTLTFQPSDWNIPRTLVLVGIDDGIPTDPEDPDTREYDVSIDAASADTDFVAFGILPVTHNLIASGEGITTIRADGDDSTPVNLDGTVTNFDDTFALDEDDKIVSSDRVIKDTMAKGIGIGTIIAGLPVRNLSTDGSSFDYLVLVFTGGNPLTDLVDFTLSLAFDYVPTSGADPIVGTLTKEAADAVLYSTGVASFLFTSDGFLEPGYVYIKLTSASGDPLTTISLLPPDPPEYLSHLIIDEALTGSAADLINPAAFAKTTMITGYMPFLST